MYFWLTVTRVPACTCGHDPLINVSEVNFVPISKLTQCPRTITFLTTVLYCTGACTAGHTHPLKGRCNYSTLSTFLHMCILSVNLPVKRSRPRGKHSGCKVRVLRWLNHFNQTKRSFICASIHILTVTTKTIKSHVISTPTSYFFLDSLTKSATPLSPHTLRTVTSWKGMKQSSKHMYIHVHHHHRS